MAAQLAMADCLNLAARGRSWSSDAQVHWIMDASPTLVVQCAVADYWNLAVAARPWPERCDGIGANGQCIDGAC